MVEKKLIIYGVGEFAEYVSYAFSHDSDYLISGFCIENSYFEKVKNEVANNKLLDFDDLEKTCSPEEYVLFIAIGNDKIRQRIFQQAKNKGYSFASYIASNSVYWENLKIGENVFISEDTAIQPFVEIGDNSIFIGSRIGHHSVIGSNVLLSLSFIGANCKIGNNSFIGMNSAVKSGVSIGNFNIIGMGCNIIANTSDYEIYSAPKAKKRSVTYSEFNEKYLH